MERRVVLTHHCYRPDHQDRHQEDGAVAVGQLRDPDLVYYHLLDLAGHHPEAELEASLLVSDLVDYLMGAELG